MKSIPIAIVLPLLSLLSVVSSFEYSPNPKTIVVAIDGKLIRSCVANALHQMHSY
jgi:hypothetical protein